MNKPAITDSAIHPILANRWSTRAYVPGAEISIEDLTAILEAARWAPSAGNLQPWRYVVTRNGDENFAKLAQTLSGFNKAWAPQASALILLSVLKTNDDGTPRKTSQYDAGLSAGFATVEAHHRGYSVHQMAGFDKPEAHKAFDLHENLEPLVILAIGVQADLASITDPKIAEREQAPRARLPLSEIVVTGL